ncbi:MAG: flagellar protein [Afipia sp.]|nr:flagellar protein [Afipia sp.]OJW62877.1 MAG: flagellar protein [Afipia sp. 64-13]
MSDIVLTASVRQNLLSLQSTADLLATTQNRLATGKKVNTALDNPTNFFTASSLDARASDISNLLDSIGNGVQVLQAANTGITSLQKLIDSAKSIANQALQTNVGYVKSRASGDPIPGATGANLLGTPDVAATATGTVTAGLASATTLAAAGFADGSSFTVNGKSISFVTGAAGDPASTADASGNVTISLSSSSGGTVATVLSAIDSITGGTSSITGNQLTVSNAVSNVTGSISFGGTASVLSKLGLADNTYAPTSSRAGQTLTVGLAGGPTTTVTFGTGSNEVSNINQLNAALLPSNLQASIDSTGSITLTTINDAASATLAVATGTATTATTGMFKNATVQSPTEDSTSQSTRAGLVAQYNNVIAQIKTTSQDASFNGVNLLNGDQLKLVFNETGKSTLNITGINLDPAGLGLGTLTQGTDFIDNVATNKVLDALNFAGSFLRSQASTLGSNLSIVQIRQDFSKQLINVLQTGSTNLTIADTNEEAANSQALSTRQSIAVSALALANQSQQSVLQLLR